MDAVSLHLNQRQMKIDYKNMRGKYWLTVLLLYLVTMGHVHCQDSLSIRDSIAPIPTAFAISEIPGEFTLLSNRLIEIEEFIQPREKIYNNDLTVQEYTVLLRERKKEILDALPFMTYQRLENHIRSWNNLNARMEAIQGDLKERIDDINSVEEELKEEQQIWETMSEVLKGESYPEGFVNAVDTVLLMLNSSLILTEQRADDLFIIENKRTRLSLFIDEMIRELEEAHHEFQANYFILDAKPIWKANDKTAAIPLVGPYFKNEISESYNLLKTYLWTNRAVLIIQLVFIILLITGFVFSRKIWPTHELDSQSKRETQAGFIFNHPFFASLLIGIVISLFFYSNRPLVLGDIFVTLMTFSTLVLLPGLLTQKIRIPLIVLLVLFLLNVAQELLPYQSPANRILIFFQSISILGLIYFVKTLKPELPLKARGERLLSGFIWIFGALMIIAIITNCIGSVKLSDFLISSTIGTLTFSAVVITIVIIFNSMIIILIKGRKAQSIPLYEQLKIFIDKRVRPIITWGAFALWLYAALTYFRLLKPVTNLIEGMMNTGFSIASVDISIGGIISFILIVFFTYILVRFVKNILKDDWVSKSSLPRGTADAISMLIRYTIVAFGIYLALNSLGLNMNKFGFIAGALGVGIGFGLQNVVLNFIAGLILSFEKPIHVGDVIEVDQEMGRVTEIGVRASKVLTWNGSEVIMPNGILISNKVINWTLANEKRRLEISVKTPFSADPEKVIEILSIVASQHPKTNDQPAPLAVFNGYESYALDFTLYAWVQFGDSLSTKSEIAVNVFKALAEAGIEAPVPFQKISVGKDKEK